MYAKWICHTVFIVLVACNSGPHTGIDRQKAARRDVQLDIGQPRSGKINFRYTEAGRISRLHKLDSLELGFDSLQLRIWLGHSMAISSHLVVIKLTDNKWDARLFSFSDSVRFEWELSPLCGWKKFADSLEIYNIVNMPHSALTENCYQCGGADGIDYVFEVATPSKYRFYYYCNPADARDCAPAKNVLQFANLLEREFEFNYIH